MNDMEKKAMSDEKVIPSAEEKSVLTESTLTTSRSVEEIASGMENSEPGMSKIVSR